jgi:DNA topoisomerase-1
VEICSGRYGPYVRHGKINATLPKGSSPETLTLEEGLELIAAKVAKGPATKKPAAKSAKAKATAKKETSTAKKDAADKSKKPATKKKTAATKKPAAKKAGKSKAAP